MAWERAGNSRRNPTWLMHLAQWVPEATPEVPAVGAPLPELSPVPLGPGNTKPWTQPTHPPGSASNPARAVEATGLCRDSPVETQDQASSCAPGPDHGSGGCHPLQDSDPS